MPSAGGSGSTGSCWSCCSSAEASPRTSSTSTRISRLPSPRACSTPNIVSGYAIEFDYQRATSCKDVTFEYHFYDKKGASVGDLVGDGHHAVTAMQVSHVHVSMIDALPSSAVRFVAVDTCHA